MSSDEKQDFPVGRGRGISHGTKIMDYIKEEHLNRYAFVQHNTGRGWHKRFLELNPNSKQLSWWHNRTSCDKKPVGTIALSAIKDIVHKPTSRTTQCLEEIKKYQTKIHEQQHQMMLIRKKAQIEEQIDEEKFVQKMLRAHPELLKHDSDEDGLSSEEKAKKREKKKTFDKELQKKYGKWQSKRRENRENEDVDFQKAADNYLDFTRNFNERVKNRINSRVILQRLQRSLGNVIGELDDLERDVEDYRRILEQSQKHYIKAKKKLCDKAKKNDFVLIFVLKSNKKEKFQFKNPRIASNWITYIKEDKEYVAPENIPQHFDNYEPDELKVEDMPGDYEAKISQSEDSNDDDGIGAEKPRSSGPPDYSDGPNTGKDDGLTTGGDGEESSSDEEG